MKLSLNLANALLAALRQSLADTVIKVYASPNVPADADAAATGTLLGVFAVGGQIAITLDQPTGNVLAKIPADQFVCIPSATGTATYFRMQRFATPDTANTDRFADPRLQGTIGKSGADMLLADPVFTNGVDKPLDYFEITLPLGF